MEITLPPGLQRFVEEKVASGTYASVSDLVSDAIIRLRDDEDAPEWTPESLRQAIQVGIDQADRGEFAEFTAADIIAEGQARLETERHTRPAGRSEG